MNETRQKRPQGAQEARWKVGDNGLIDNTTRADRSGLEETGFQKLAPESCGKAGKLGVANADVLEL